MIDGTSIASKAEALLRTSDFLCLWRLCGNAGCRRARACRGRAHLCAKRNSGALPKGARGFFKLFLAAKLAGVPFEDFREEMEGREEAFFAWCKATHASLRRPCLWRKRQYAHVFTAGAARSGTLVPVWA